MDLKEPKEVVDLAAVALSEAGVSTKESLAEAAVVLARAEIARELGLVLIGREELPVHCVTTAHELWKEIGGVEASDRWTDVLRAQLPGAKATGDEAARMVAQRMADALGMPHDIIGPNGHERVMPSPKAESVREPARGWETPRELAARLHPSPTTLISDWTREVAYQASRDSIAARDSLWAERLGPLLAAAGALEEGRRLVSQPVDPRAAVDARPRPRRGLEAGAHRGRDEAVRAPRFRRPEGARAARPRLTDTQRRQNRRSKDR